MKKQQWRTGKEGERRHRRRRKWWGGRSREGGSRGTGDQDKIQPEDGAEEEKEGLSLHF